MAGQHDLLGSLDHAGRPVGTMTAPLLPSANDATQQGAPGANGHPDWMANLGWGAPPTQTTSSPQPDSPYGTVTVTGPRIPGSREHTPVTIPRLNLTSLQAHGAGPVPMPVVAPPAAALVARAMGGSLGKPPTVVHAVAPEALAESHPETHPETVATGERDFHDFTELEMRVYLNTHKGKIPQEDFEKKKRIYLERRVATVDFKDLTEQEMRAYLNAKHGELPADEWEAKKKVYFDKKAQNAAAKATAGTAGAPSAAGPTATSAPVVTTTPSKPGVVGRPVAPVVSPIPAAPVSSHPAAGHSATASEAGDADDTRSETSHTSDHSHDSSFKRATKGWLDRARNYVAEITKDDDAEDGHAQAQAPVQATHAAPRQPVDGPACATCGTPFGMFTNRRQSCSRCKGGYCQKCLHEQRPIFDRDVRYELVNTYKVMPVCADCAIKIDAQIMGLAKAYHEVRAEEATPAEAEPHEDLDAPTELESMQPARMARPLKGRSRAASDASETSDHQVAAVAAAAVPAPSTVVAGRERAPSFEQRQRPVLPAGVVSPKVNDSVSFASADDEISRLNSLVGNLKAQNVTKDALVTKLKEDVLAAQAASERLADVERDLAHYKEIVSDKEHAMSEVESLRLQLESSLATVKADSAQRATEADEARAQLARAEAAREETALRADSATAQLRDATSRIALLEAQLKQREDQVSDATAQLTARDSARASAAAKDEEIAALKSQLVSWERRMAERDSESAAQASPHADGEVARLSGLLRERSDEIAALSSQVAVLQQQVQSRDAEVATRARQVEAAAAEVGASQAARKQEAEIASERIEQLNGDLDKREKSLLEAREQGRQAKAESESMINGLRGELLGAREEAAALKTRLAGAEVEIGRLDTRARELERKSSVLEADLTQARVKNERAEREYADLTASLHAVEAELTQARAEGRQFQAAYNAQVEQTRQLQEAATKTIEQAQQMIGERDAHLVTMDQTITAMDNSMKITQNALKETQDRLRDREADLSAQVTGLKQTIMQLTQELTAVRVKKVEAEDRVGTLTAELETARLDATTASAQLGAERSTGQVMRDRALTAEAKCGAQEGQLEALRNELATVRARVVQLEADVAEKAMTIDALTGRVEAVGLALEADREANAGNTAYAEQLSAVAATEKFVLRLTEDRFTMAHERSVRLLQLARAVLPVVRTFLADLARQTGVDPELQSTIDKVHELAGTTENLLKAAMAPKKKLIGINVNPLTPDAIAPAKFDEADALFIQTLRDVAVRANLLLRKYVFTAAAVPPSPARMDVSRSRLSTGTRSSEDF